MKTRTGFIARPGYRFLAASLGLALAGLVLGSLLVGLGLVLTVFFAYFFRDPERAVPMGNGVIVAPADGKVIGHRTVREAHLLHQPAKMISIFMNVFDVHVNRAPVAGQVKALAYQPGRYVAADRPEAPQVNEQLAVLVENDSGRRLVYVQIAGLVARRIISYIQEGDRLETGERVGLICFGSRVDLYLPADTQVEVKVGDRVKAGVSVVGRLP